MSVLNSIRFEPVLPCVHCGRPASLGMVSSLPEALLNQQAAPRASLLLQPVCDACIEQQAHQQEYGECRLRQHMEQHPPG